ncbi:MAG: molybdopterin-dependent oxidoreductase, partial [Myxococcota bacterium]
RLLASARVVPELSQFADGAEAYIALLRSRSVETWAREADVCLADVDVLADVVADRPCAFLLGWGMARRSRGGAIMRAVDALCAASGNVGIPGGGANYCTHEHGALASLNLPAPPRTVAVPTLGRALVETHDPAIRAVWITSGNPVAMLPDSKALQRGLQSRDLVVVVDSFLTDTARCASVVLPTTTLVEDDDLLLSFGHHWLGASRPVMQPPPGVLTDLQIAQRLAEVIDARNVPGVPKLAPRMDGTTTDWKRRLMEPLTKVGVGLEQLESHAVRNPYAPEIPFAQRRFATDTGRMQLVGEAPPPMACDPRHPLWLMSNSVRDAQCSQWSVEPPEVLPAVCHPEAVPGCADGQLVRLENELGSLAVRLCFDARQRRDVIMVPKGGHLSGGHCANALISDRLTDMGEGAAYLDARVRVSCA